ncbi:dynamin family protein [Kribbella sp. CA-245084]|uniref:dynamin family protein n=1 Tax=Kribbella sp. CA-245084 TaxID=3239940 RepID=UPI003D945838
MADTRSAAGEGSEPRVPSQDQPAQELANLIAQSTPKPRGFWRRRRKKSAPDQEPTATPVPPEAQSSDEPSTGAHDGVATDGAVTSDSKDKLTQDGAATPGQPTAAPESTEPTASTSESAQAAEAAEAGAESPTTDSEHPGTTTDAPSEANHPSPTAEATPTATSPTDPSTSTDQTSTEHTGVPTAEATPKPAEASTQATDDAAQAGAGTAQAGTGTAQAGGGTAHAGGGTAQAGEDAAQAGGGTGQAGGGTAEGGEGTGRVGELSAQAGHGNAVQGSGGAAAPRVGVVYEPDESPDGFPLEYGNIIIGLPKQPENGTQDAQDGSDEQQPNASDAEDTDAAADETAEQATREAADESTETAQESTDDAADEAAEGVASEVTDDAADSAAGSAVADATEHAGAGTADEAADAAGESDGGAVDGAADEAAEEAGSSSAENADEVASDGAAETENDGARDAGNDVVGEGGAEPGAAEDAGAGAAAGSAADDGSDEPAGEAAESAAEGAAGAAGRHAADGSADVAAVDGTEPAAGDPAADADGTAADGADESAGAAAAPAGAADGADEAADEAGDDAGAEAADDVAADGASDEVAGEAADGVAEAAADGGGDAASDAADESAGDVAGEAAEDDGAGSVDGAAESADEAADGAADGAVAGDGGDDSDEDGAEGDAADGDGEEELTAAQLRERLAAEQAAMALITALMKLRGVLAGSRLPLEVVGADEARQQQKGMLDQLDDYLLPRLVQLEAPVLAVVGGSTGAGKSTLVNTVIGKVVSEPGVLRPTTRSPVLIHHPADADWFVGDRVLPGMARTSSDEPGGMEDAGQLRLVAADTVPRGLAILDAPDIDSVVEANRDLATQLLGAADLWLFVTTAARYSDAVPWEFLQTASDRSTAVAVVLDRAPSETIDDITGHLAQMLLERGLGDSPLFSIQETVVDGNGMLPQATVASIKDWLVDLAADAEARAGVVRRTLQGAVSAMVKTTAPFAEAVKAQADTAIELRSSVESAYDQAVKDIAKACQDGTLMRGEVLARWQEFVGTGELLKGLQSNAGRLRDRLKTSLGNKPAETRDVSDAIQSGLESLLREHATAAAERAEKAWQATAPGRQLLAVGDAALAEEDPESSLGALSPAFPDTAARAVREWQAFVLDVIRKEGGAKKSTARILEYGVNGLGLSLMVVVFARETGIPKGAEASVGAGSAVVGQRLLEAVFGDKAVQGMVDKAREDLDGKVHALMDAEFARYLAVLDQHPVDAETARQLTEAARAVEDCT